MPQTSTSCSKGVATLCRYCNATTQKHGFTKTGKQRLRCLDCRKTQMLRYTYYAYDLSLNAKIVILIREGVGIRGLARVLKISATTVLRRITAIAASITPPGLRSNHTYEVDELRTFIKKKAKLVWIVCALDKSDGTIVRFHVGRRTNATLGTVLDSLLLANAREIYTDRLRHYRYLIPGEIHRTPRFGTNRLERRNLNLRTHLKRLNRKTICFSRSRKMLEAILAIYFWAM